MVIKILLIIIIAYALGCIPLPKLICSRLPVKDDQAPEAATYPQVMRRHGWLFTFPRQPWQNICG